MQVNLFKFSGVYVEKDVKVGGGQLGRRKVLWDKSKVMGKEKD